MFPLALSQSRPLSHRDRNPIDEFRRSFDTLFNQFFRDWDVPISTESETYRPLDFQVEQTDDEFLVRAAVPGFEPEELDIQVADNTLTVKAEKKQEDKNGRQYRSYYRSVALPPGVDPERVQASCRHGMLELHLPRSEAAKPRKIAVQGEPQESTGTGDGQKKIAGQKERK